MYIRQSHIRNIHKYHTFLLSFSCFLFNCSFAFLARAACSVFPDTLARCSSTVRICIFLAYGLLIFLTLDIVALASDTVANLMLTVSLGFSSVYSLLSEPFGFLPVPTLGSAFFFFFAAFSAALASVAAFALASSAFFFFFAAFFFS